MELRQLKYFVTVARTRNFSQAARELYMTQGTLSQQIKQLEDEMGTQLFERDSRNVRLTETGEEMLPLAQDTLNAALLCRNRIKDLHGALTGSLNVGTTHSFSGLMVDAVKNFLKQNPGVKVHLYCGTAAELLEMLRERKLDLAIAFKPVKEYEDIESEVLFRTSLSVIMRDGHPLAEKQDISLQELEKHSIVLPGVGLQARRTFDNFVGLDTRKLNVHIEVNDPDLIMDIVQGTNLVTMLSPLAAYYRKNLVAVPLEGGSYSMTGCIHSLRDGYHKRSSQVLVNMIRESAQIERLCKNLEM